MATRASARRLVALVSVLSLSILVGVTLGVSKAAASTCSNRQASAARQAAADPATIVRALRSIGWAPTSAGLQLLAGAALPSHPTYAPDGSRDGSAGAAAIAMAPPESSEVAAQQIGQLRQALATGAGAASTPSRTPQSVRRKSGYHLVDFGCTAG